VLQGLAGLWRLTELYPDGHPIVSEAATALQTDLEACLGDRTQLRIDIIEGDLFVNGQPLRGASAAVRHGSREFTEIGIDSLHFGLGVDAGELCRLAYLLAELRDDPGSDETLEERLGQREIRHVSLGRLVPLNTQWRYEDCPKCPQGTLDPDYAESLLRAEETFGSLIDGRNPSASNLRELVNLLVYKVARSQAALGQIVAVKQYENHTYCHSVNVAILSLLLGRELGMDEPTIARLSEAALLHDVGKTRMPLDILSKPGPLDQRERKLLERHPRLGAEILAGIPGLGPLTPTVALEHHRGYAGGGYPDLGEATPHPLSQLVAVVDIYEALTGARSYRDPALPEQACLIMARMAGEKLNPALVKVFVNSISFFPVGSLVRTSLGERGVVLSTTQGEPLHPIVGLIAGESGPPGNLVGVVDTRDRDVAGKYVRHIAETLRPGTFDVDLSELLASARESGITL